MATSQVTFKALGPALLLLALCSVASVSTAPAAKHSHPARKPGSPQSKRQSKTAPPVSKSTPPSQAASPPPPSPLPSNSTSPTPVGAPTISSMPSTAIPDEANVEGYFVDAENNVYMAGPIVTSAQFTSTSILSNYFSREVYQTNCYYSVTFYKFDFATGRLLASYNDSVSAGRESRNNPAEYGVTSACNGPAVSYPGIIDRYPTAAVDGAGRYLYWVIIGGGQGEEGLMESPPPTADFNAINNANPAKVYAGTLLIRRIDLATGSAQTVYTANVTESWAASVSTSSIPSLRLYCGTFSVWDLNVHSNSNSADTVTLLLAEVDAVNMRNPPKCCSPVVGRINLTAAATSTSTKGSTAAAAFSAFPVGLGTSFSAWAHDSAGGDLLYLLYNRAGVAPFCDLAAAAMAAAISEVTYGCMPHNLIRAKAAPGASPDVLPLEVPMAIMDRRNSRNDVSLVVDIPPTQLASSSRPSNIYLSDAQACQVKRLDPSTGNITVVAGYGYLSAVGPRGGPEGYTAAAAETGGGPMRPVCSLIPVDGPASAGKPIGAPMRLRRGSPGTVFFLEPQPASSPETRYLVRRISGL